MKAAFVTDIETVEIRDIPTPLISDNEVLIKTATVGVCGSDLHLFRGTHPFRRSPAILGHEIAGEIVDIGKNVTKFSIGDRVTVEPQLGCGECAMCQRGFVNLCYNRTAPGTPKWIGAFSEYFNSDQSILYKLADTTSYECGTLAEPLAVAVHSLNCAKTKTGALVILGCGTIGQLILLLAKRQGYSPIIITDTHKFHRDFALTHGADYAFDPRADDVPAKVKELTSGLGADLVYVSAGSRDILDQAADCTRKCGEIGLVAMITEKIPFYCYDIVFCEKTIFGAMCYTSEDFAEAVRLINEELDVKDYITQCLDGIDKTQEGLDILCQKKTDVIKVLIKISD